jgi:capsular polysaccharide export protein
VTSEVCIDGPVLLLFGPIGSFFSRFANHLERQGVPVWKVSFPLYEFGFSEHQRLNYSGDMAEFKCFLGGVIEEKGIRHIFMYGDFIDPHRIAIQLVQELNQRLERPFELDAWVFELGYIRPNYVSLEKEHVNARSGLNRPVNFYKSLPSVDVIPQARRETGIRWRKWWKAPTFIQHSFTSYPIISGDHKLQPKPSYLLAQIRGFLRKYLYRFSERAILETLMDGTPYVLVPLQVASDSQVQLSSGYGGMPPFIAELITSFAIHGRPQDRLVFKHHPRDRGYNHYGSLIQRLAREHGVSQRVFYFHDGALGPILKRARGVITINSTVGLQALYHSVPTKVMGKTFYNLPGLTDQKPLADFWHNPQPSNRDLFRKFYLHLINSTQINGNFDGDFPFDTAFRISPELALGAEGPRPSVVEVLLRIFSFLLGYLTYIFQLLALLVGARDMARRLLEQASRQGLAALGVRVLIDRRMEPVSRAQIHIANHGHPLDVLLVQGHFRECSITTAALHLRWLLPFFSLSARNYGHVTLNHLSASSRLDSLRQLLRLMQRRGRLFLFPSGSLVTPITERVSGSLSVLARRSDAVVIPWFFTYRGFARQEGRLAYRPFALLLRRLTGPQATILCREGAPIDPHQFTSSEAFSCHIRQLYGQVQSSLERAS